MLAVLLVPLVVPLGALALLIAVFALDICALGTAILYANSARNTLAMGWVCMSISSLLRIIPRVVSFPFLSRFGDRQSPCL